MPLTDDGIYATDAIQKACESFVLNKDRVVGKTIAKVERGIDDQMLFLFTDGSWTSTFQTAGDFDFYLQDAEILGLITQDDLDKQSKLEGEAE